MIIILALNFEPDASVHYPEFYIRGAVADGNSGFYISEQFDGSCREGNNPRSISKDSNRPKDQGSEAFNSYNRPQNTVDSKTFSKAPQPIKHNRPVGQGDFPKPLVIPNPDVDGIEGRRFIDGSQMVPSRPGRELGLDMEDLDIPWRDLVLKERIGSGSTPPLSNEHVSFF